MTVRAFGSIAGAVVIAALGGWVWGATGKAAIALERRAMSERAELAEARGSILGGRVSLYNLNFGAAATEFAEARRAVEIIQIRWRETAQAERAGQLEIVLAHLKDAERLAAAVDPAAQMAADQANQALGAVRK